MARIADGQVFGHQHVPADVVRRGKVEFDLPGGARTLDEIVRFKETVQFLFAGQCFFGDFPGIAPHAWLPRGGGQFDIQGLLFGADDILPHPADFGLLVVIGLQLMFLLGQFLFDVVAVIARVEAQSVRGRVEFENGRDGVVEKGAVMRDNQGRAVEAPEPVFQPFEHGDVEVIGGFVEQQQVRLCEQETGEQQSRFLAAAQFPNGCLGVDVG